MAFETQQLFLAKELKAKAKRQRSALCLSVSTSLCIILSEYEGRRLVSENRTDFRSVLGLWQTIL